MVREARRFPCAPQSVAEARLFVAAALTAAGRAEMVDSARLVVSELATNAIQHAESDFDVEVDIGDVVRVAVCDRLDGQPVPSPFDVSSPSGRGLALIAALADRWGVEPTAFGKRVWWEGSV